MRGRFNVAAVDGGTKEDEVGRHELAGQPAYRVRYFQFDSALFAFYLTAGERVVELSFRSSPLANQPLAAVQLDVYALLLDTFRLQ